MSLMILTSSTMNTSSFLHSQFFGVTSKPPISYLLSPMRASVRNCWTSAEGAQVPDPLSLKFFSDVPSFY